ncbi:hypothetical protein FHU36_003683 [Nonomuraea muscovyensis]|uniref:MFS transporter n=1 Tax=Nonomuraea muscovyensis TaxID=1124761 RepID=A0A7X0C2T3_9ACTN|nr:hypothetical protein [Nonomuraea muscovyensis]MBB6347138.1 hypothetical protein [Nonomuraea muscovyensis]
MAPLAPVHPGQPGGAHQPGCWVCRARAQRNAGAYQGLSQTGYAISAMVSPVLVTAIAIEHETVGWLALAALFVAGGTGAAAVARRHRPRATSVPDAPVPAGASAKAR